MVQKEAIVRSATGLHARPGAALTELAMSFNSNITIEHQGKSVNAKEVLEVLTANINCGDTVLVKAEGSDEETALAEIVRQIETTEAEK